MTKESQPTIAETLWVKGLSSIKRYVPKEGQEFPEMIHRTDDFIHVRRTMYLGNKLAEVVNQMSLYYKPDVRKICDMAYHHDDSEIFNNDLLVTEKQKMNKESLREYDRKEDLAAYAVAHFIFGLKPPLDQVYVDRQRERKKKLTLESQIVDVADKWDAVCEILHEIRCGNKSFAQLLNSSKQTFKSFTENYTFFSIIDENPLLRFDKIPSPEETVKLPTLDIDDLNKPTDIAKFMSLEKTEGWPEFYRTWAKLSSDIFNRSPEKFLFPGWYLQLWTRWNTFEKGKSTASGLIIP